jgi:hypothetical protein
MTASVTGSVGQPPPRVRAINSRLALMPRTSSVRSARVIARASRCSKRSRFGTANPAGVASFLMKCS